jgi:sigma-B regulation protein RsbQ
MSEVRARHNIHVLGEGSHTLILGHGLGTDQTIWRLVAQRLATDHRVVVLDWVGCGGADPRAFEAERYRSLHGHASDLAQVIEAMKVGAVTYIGHSAGAMIGLLAAVAAPHLFRGLVLVAGSPRYLNDPPGYLGGSTPADVAALLSLLDVNFLGWTSTIAGIAAKAPELRAELEVLFGKNNQEHLREFATAVFQSDYRSELHKLTVPALVVGVTRDDMVPVTVNEYLHSQLRDSTYVCLDLAGHCPQMTHPELIEATIRAYLRERER